MREIRDAVMGAIREGVIRAIREEGRERVQGVEEIRKIKRD